MEFHVAGQRPWGYWQFEIGEHPRRAGSKIVPIPYGSGGSWEFEEYESDEDALERLGLLEPWEIAQIEAWKMIREE